MKPTTQSPEAILCHHDAGVMPRARIELAIATRLLRDLTAAGYRITEHEDGFHADTEDEWLNYLFNLDEARLIVTNAESGQTSFVLLVFGNNGYELISDYGVNLEHIIAPIYDWSTAAEEVGTVPKLKPFPAGATTAQNSEEAVAMQNARDWQAAIAADNADNAAAAADQRETSDSLTEERLRDLLRRAESFISGFEDDESQEGIPALLAAIRAEING